jgi:nucleoside-diphosphate-sugar epimerase
MPLTEKDLDHIITHSSSLWEKLAGRRIFVTGGTGFFGKWLMESFNRANKQLGLNSQMLVLTRNPNTFLKQYPHFNKMSAIDFYQGDIRDFNFPKGNFDFIVHAATESSDKLNSEEPLLMIDVIVEGTRRLLDFARHCQARKFLLTSSGAVYGRQRSDTPYLQEDYHDSQKTTDTDSVYGQAKRSAELLSITYQKQYGIEVSIARCFAFVGPYLNLDIHFAIGNFIRDGLSGKTINVLGDGTPYRSYLYAADLAIWLWTILLDGKPGRAYNVGSKKEVSISQLAKIVSDCFPQKPQVNIAQKPEPEAKPIKYVPSVERAENELGLQCQIGLEEAIKRTIQFHQENYK